MTAAQFQGLADQQVDLREPFGPQVLGHAAQAVAGVRLTVSVQRPDIRFRQHHAAGVGQPDDFSQLGIQPGEDYVTLLTCTPYGINTHRLLVQGIRVEEGGSAAPGRVDPPNELQAVPTGYLLAAALLACGLLILIYLLLCGRKTAPGRRETHE